MEQTQAGFDPAAFDLAAAAAEGYELALRNPATGEPLGASLTIVGEDAPRVVDFQRHMFEQLQREDRQARKTGRPVERSFDDMQEHLVQKAVAHTIGWKGMMDKGAPLAFSEPAAAGIYRRHRWLRDLVLEEGKVLGNFAPR